MTEEKPYSVRELDEKFAHVTQVSNDNRHALSTKIQNLQNVMELRLSDMAKNNADSLQRIELSTNAIDQKVAYTNGKVRRITIALIAVGAFSVGLGFQQLAPLLKLLLAV
jgi:hypothetical protein